MANFGDINTDLALTGGKAVRRNSGDSAFEAFTPLEASDLTNTKKGSFGIAITGAAAPITTGLKGTLVMPYAGTITGWQIFETSSTPISTNTVVDVWLDTYANYPPTSGDSIAGTEKPTLTNQTKNEDTSLSTWSTSVAAGDVIAFNVDSNDDAENLLIVINITKS
jgi:hypothetical protein